MDASTTASADWREQLKAAMATAGMTAPATIVADGKLHRFDPDGSNGDAGWYSVHQAEHFTAWSFGDWRTGTKHKGHTKPTKKLTRKERLALRKELKERNAAREAGQRGEWEKCAEAARARWATLTPALPTQEYLKRKKIEPFGARQDGVNLVIAMTSIDDGKIWSWREILRNRPLGAALRARK
jgi:putative DNA primase/helicase